MKSAFYLLVSAIVLSTTACSSPPKKKKKGLIARVIEKAIEDAKEEEKERASKEYKVDDDGTITAEDLTSAFGANEIRANENFKDSTFTVIGEIESIDISLETDLPVISLEGDSFLEGVQCHFNETDGLSQYNIGDKVRVTGTCAGQEVFVQMIDCSEIEKI